MATYEDVVGFAKKVSGEIAKPPMDFSSDDGSSLTGWDVGLVDSVVNRDYHEEWGTTERVILCDDGVLVTQVRRYTHPNNGSADVEWKLRAASRDDLLAFDCASHEVESHPVPSQTSVRTGHKYGPVRFSEDYRGVLRLLEAMRP